MGIECPILVPFERAPYLRKLHVHFVAICINIGADELGNDIENSGMAHCFPENRMRFGRTLKPTQTGTGEIMRGFQIKDIVTFFYLSRLIDKLIGHSL